MANIIGSLMAKIGLDISGFTKGITEVKTATKTISSTLENSFKTTPVVNYANTLSGLKLNVKTLQTEYKTLINQLGDSADKEDGLRQRTESLTKQIDAQNQVIQKAKQKYDEVVASKGEDSKAAQSLALKLAVEEKALSSVQAELNKVNTAQDKMGSAADKLGGKVQDFSKTAGIALTAAGGAIAAGLGLAVNKSADFEAEMSRVGAVAGASGTDLDALKKSALDLGATTSLSASEVAQGMELMGQMGYNTQQIIAAMPGVINATVASGEDMATVSDTVASALNAFGLKAADASKVADILATAANDSAAGVEDMSYAFKYAAPVANQVGMSIEQLSAATEIMANAGIKGEQAGTTMRAAILSLVSPTKQAQTEMDALGIKVKDSQGNMLPFDQIVGELKTSLQGMGQAQQAAALSTIFGNQSVSGMLTIVQAGPAKLDALTKSLQNSGGASETAATKMRDNLKGALDNLSGAVDTAEISMGSVLTPAIEKVANTIQNLVNWFNNLSPGMQEAITIGIAVTSMLLILSGALAFTTFALGALATAEWAVILPFAGIILAITAVVAVAVALVVVIVTNWTKITQFLTATWQSISSAASSIWDSVASYFTTLWNNITGIFQTAVNAVSGFLSNAWNAISSTAQTIWNAIKDFFAKWWPLLVIVFLGPLGYLIDLVVQHWTTIQQKTSEIWNAVTTFLNGIWTGIKTTATSIWNGISAFVKGVWQSISGTATTVWDAIKTAITGPVQTVDTTLRSVWDGIKSFFSDEWNNLKSMATTIFQDIANAIVAPFKNIHIPMPSLSFTTSTASFAGISIPVPVPHISWNAKGGLYDGASVIGIGEAGPEAAVPLSGSAMKPFAKAIASQMPNNSSNMNDAPSLEVHVHGDVYGYQDFISKVQSALTGKLSGMLHSELRQPSRQGV